MKKKKIAAVAVSSVLLFVAGIVLSLCLGSRTVAFTKVLEALSGKHVETLGAKVVLARVPRTIFGILAGGALGISGTLMQSITRNPVADPSILGVNTGASLFVVVGITFFNLSTASGYIWFALIGAALTSFCVYGIASIGPGGITPIKLALAGASISAILSSLVSLIILPRADVMDAYRFWQVGSLSGATWEGIKSVLPFIIVGLIISVIFMHALNALALGDEVATGLGVNTGLVRIMCAIAGVILCGATTAIAGPIGFIGLMIPHIVRLILGSDMKNLIPMSAIGGAILLMISDVLGRIIGSPSELEVGIITAFLGAPILIIIARKAKVKSI